MQKLSQGLYPPLDTQVVGILSERAEMSNSLKSQYDYVDTDSIKQILNSRYGMEIQMRSEFIVLHINEEPAIVRKSAISYVSREKESGKAIVRVDCNIYYVDEQYGDVVRRLFK